MASLGNILRKALKKHYVYKDNKGRIGNYFLPACAEEVGAIDRAIGKHVTALSGEFFEDIQLFNLSFSRASTTTDEEETESD